MAERFLNYRPPISQELRDQYEGAMSQEKRWQNGTQVSDKDETLLDHVEDLFEMHGEVGILYPRLFAAVDGPETEHMIYIHDGGEIGGLDLSHSAPDYDLVRPKIKRRERATFRYMTGKYIDDVELRAYTRQLYARNDMPNSNDTKAQYVHMQDKIQATRFGLKHVFPASRLNPGERIQQINHIYKITMPFAVNLFRNIGFDAQEELVDYIGSSFQQFQEAGYPESLVRANIAMARQDLLSQREVTLT